ncbi:hypothetical protein S40293_06936 [Stachybotrys chartarum IBT 40293]|nr:hypothetical protein S40293_06936 [Stachybotrys chartarum IBT 40293]
MRTALALGPVVHSSSFSDSSDGGSPTSLVSAGSLSRQSSLYDPRNDDAVRRFSAAAPSAHSRQLAVHMTAAKTAYAKAFLMIRQTSRDASVNEVLESGSVRDVMETVTSILATTPRKSQVSDFVNTLHHYHGVFDVLCQADLSYLSLIWGGMKLILIMVKNHSDLLMSILDMLTEIGLDLSRIEVTTKLYPTKRMIELTSMLYGAIVDFLQEVITYFQKNKMRRFWSSVSRPFEPRFGSLRDRIRFLANAIQKDAVILHALQSASMAQHQVDSFLHGAQFTSILKSGLSNAVVPELLSRIKMTLFQGFAHEAKYHEDLAATYAFTAGGSWDTWFAEEQRYLPSGMRSASSLNQGLCDAPDSQHALQWVAQQRVQSPGIPSAYLIWVKGMTAQSAIASLLFQVLQQRPDVVSEHNIDLAAFRRANAGIKPLWDMFVHLMRALGGCLIYITIGSTGPDEFAVVDKFVKTVRNWDGPPISVTVIHPFNEGFVLVDDAVALDGAYDVHPSLTTTDALYHVIMLELGRQPDMSETIRGALWESLWREVRYAVIGIAFTQITDAILAAAKEAGHARCGDGLSQDDLDVWVAGVEKWTEDRIASNIVREQIQRHLDIVALEIPAATKTQLSQNLKRSVFTADMDCLGTRNLTQPQRDRVWQGIQASVAPGTVAVFGLEVEELVAEALDDYCQMVGRRRQTKKGALAVLRAMDDSFGWDGRWRETFSGEGQQIVDGITDGIVTGFRDVITALLEPAEDTGSA